MYGLNYVQHEKDCSRRESDRFLKLSELSFAQLAVYGEIETIKQRLVANPLGGPSFVKAVATDVASIALSTATGRVCPSRKPPLHDVNSVSKDEPHTALFYAIRHNHPTIITLLLKNGAVLNDLDEEVIETGWRSCSVM